MLRTLAVLIAMRMRRMRSVRAAIRDGSTSGDRDNNDGFRIARMLP